MKGNVFDKLVVFLQNLEQQKVSYMLGHYRDEAIMVTVVMPGERWEVEFLSSGSVEVEKFISNGEIAGEEALRELFTKYLEPENLSTETSQNTVVTIKR